MADENTEDTQDINDQTPPMSEMAPGGQIGVMPPMGGMGMPQQPQTKAIGPGRHLLTGLVSVLIDGLQAGMRAPMNEQGPSQAATLAAQLPQQRQQQNISLQSQQLQLKAQLAQSRIQDLQTKLIASKLEEQTASGLTDAGWNFFQQAMKNGTAKMVSGEAEDSGAAQAKLKELHDADPKNSGNLFVAPGMKKGTWGVWEIFPKNALESDIDVDLPGSKDQGGSIEDETIHIPAGTDMGTAKVIMSNKLRDHTAKLHDESTRSIAAQKTQTAVQVQQMKGQQAQAKAAAGGTADKQTDASYNTQIKRLDSTRKPLDDMAARLNRLQNSLNLRTPQADAEIAPQLMVAMAGGQGSGVRITQAEINRTEGGRSGWENLKARIQHWQTDPSQALSITDAQRTQMRQLVGMVLGKVNTKLTIVGNTEQGLTNATDKKQHRQLMTDMRSQLEAVDSGKFPDRETANKVRDAAGQSKRVIDLR